MRLGRQAEVSTIVDTVPDLVAIGDESFFADGIYLGRAARRSRHVDAGAGDRRRSRRSSATTPCSGRGRDLADGALLGVCTVATPAMAAAPERRGSGIRRCRCRGRRAAVDRRTTHQPSWLRRVNRFGWEAARLLLPLGSVPGRGMVGRSPAGRERSACAWCSTSRWRPPRPPRRWRRRAGPEVAAARPRAPGDASALVVLVQPLGLPLRAVGPLRPWFVAPLEGTLWLSWYLRAMGMSIGRRVLLGPGSRRSSTPT